MSRFRQRSREASDRIAVARLAQRQGAQALAGASDAAAAGEAVQGVVADVAALDTDVGGLETDLAARGLPAGGTTGQLLTKASNTDWDAGWQDPPASGGNGVSILNFHSDAGASAALTNQANAEQYLANNARNSAWFDASGFTEVRIVARVSTGSASANSPRLYPQYWNGSAWVTIGSGTGTQAISLTTAGQQKTDWIAIPAPAQADVEWRIAQNGGDGVADPALGNTSMQFR